MSEILEAKKYLSFYLTSRKIIWYFNPAGFREDHTRVLIRANHCPKAAI